MCKDLKIQNLKSIKTKIDLVGEHGLDTTKQNLTLTKINITRCAGMLYPIFTPSYLNHQL